VEQGVLRVFVLHVKKNPVGLPGLDFEPLEEEVATFSLPDLTLRGVQALPWTSASRPYGATVLNGPDGNFYLYAMHKRDVYLARVPVGQLLNPSAWTFASGDPLAPTWSADSAQAVPLEWFNVPALLPQLGDGHGPSAQPWVTPYGSGYLATSKLADAFSDEVSVFTASTPAGPWTYYGPVAGTRASGLSSYGAFAMSPATNPIVVFSTNRSPFSQAPFTLSIQTYGPHFVAPLPNSLPALQ
jgi:hypothetical protein